MVNLRSHTTRLGVLDIGSNTIHMLIVDAAPGARPDPEASTKSTVLLMKYLKDDGSIKKSGIEAILEAVSQCSGWPRNTKSPNRHSHQQRRMIGALDFDHLALPGLHALIKHHVVNTGEHWHSRTVRGP